MADMKSSSAKKLSEFIERLTILFLYLLGFQDVALCLFWMSFIAFPEAHDQKFAFNFPSWWIISSFALSYWISLQCFSIGFLMKFVFLVCGVLGGKVFP